jgi:dTMP kinase
MIKGKLLVIEGIDGVGKNTQAKLLHEAVVKSTGEPKTLFISFPIYQSDTGKIIGKYLNGELPGLTRQEIAMLFANDRLAHKNLIMSALEAGYHVVADRYVLSNIVYQSSWFASKILSLDTSDHDSKKYFYSKASEMENYVRTLEYVTHAMPIPDITFVLKLPVEVATEKIKSKATRDYTAMKLDINEADVNLQIQTASAYAGLLNKDIKLIDCWDVGNKTQRTIEDIHKEIVHYASSQISILCRGG